MSDEKKILPFLGHLFPGDFPVTQDFGANRMIYKRFPSDGSYKWRDENGDVHQGMAGHNGVDFGLPVGTVLLACCDMKITQVVDTGHAGYGMKIRGITEQEEGIFELTHGHCSRIDVAVGDEVKYLDEIGLSGNTGFSWKNGRPTTKEERAAGYGAHLHFGLRELNEKHEVLNWLNGYFGSINPGPYWDPKLLQKKVKKKK